LLLLIRATVEDDGRPIVEDDGRPIVEDEGKVGYISFLFIIFIS